MKQRFLKGIMFFFVSSAVFVSCDNSKTDLDLDLEESKDTTVLTTDDGPQISYAVPTPNELFEIVKILGGELNMELVNSLDNKNKYVDLKSKALNFGVYSADIGYMSCFENGIAFLKYTKVLENLGNELGISDVFDKTLMDRIENNEENFDSLFTISNETYYDSYLYLEENKKGQELSLIIIGGYVESVYIISNLVNVYSNSNPIIEKIGDQHLVLDNIIDFCSQYADESAVAEALSDIMKLQSIFEDNMDFVESNPEGENGTDVDGVATFASKGSFTMNENTFNLVKEEVIKLRNKITQK